MEPHRPSSCGGCVPNQETPIQAACASVRRADIVRSYTDPFASPGRQAFYRDRRGGHHIWRCVRLPAFSSTACLLLAFTEMQQRPARRQTQQGILHRRVGLTADWDVGPNGKGELHSCLHSVWDHPAPPCELTFQRVIYTDPLSCAEEPLAGLLLIRIYSATGTS